MKYKYVCVIIITIYYICHMYHIHTYSIVPRPIAMNVTQPVPSPLNSVPLKHHNAFKHYSYHKQTLSLFYKKRQGQHHIR